MIEPLGDEFGWGVRPDLARDRDQPGPVRRDGAVLGGADGPLRGAPGDRRRARGDVGRIRGDDRDDRAVAARPALGRRDRRRHGVPVVAARGDRGHAVVRRAARPRDRAARRPPTPRGSSSSCRRSRSPPARRGGSGPRRSWRSPPPSRSRSRCCSSATTPPTAGSRPFGATEVERPPAAARQPVRPHARRPPRRGPHRASSGCSPAPSSSAAPRPSGIIGTHLIPAAHDHGIGEVQAASLLAVIGVFDLIGVTTVRVAHRPLGPGAAAVLLLRAPGPVAVLPAARARRDGPRDGRVRRGLRPRLGGDRAADGRDHRRRVRPRAGGRGVRLDLRRPPARGRVGRVGGRPGPRVGRHLRPGVPRHGAPRDRRRGDDPGDGRRRAGDRGSRRPRRRRPSRRVAP